MPPALVVYLLRAPLAKETPSRVGRQRSVTSRATRTSRSEPTARTILPTIRLLTVIRFTSRRVFRESPDADSPDGHRIPGNTPATRLDTASVPADRQTR